MASYGLRVNGFARSVESSDPEKPLLYVLRGMGLTAAKFGCGLGQGLRIAIRQIAAEELGIGVDKIRYVEGDTALTTRTWVPQRHRLPSSAVRTSASLGFAFSARSAAARMIMPPVQ